MLCTQEVIGSTPIFSTNTKLNNMKKEELEKEVRLLKERVEANKKMSDGYVDDLAKAEQELKDFNKPVLTSPINEYDGAETLPKPTVN